MKIAAFTTKDGLQSWGVINDENQTILCAADLEEMYFTFLPETIDELIEQGNEGVLALASALEKHKEDPIAEPYELSEVVLTKPANVQRNVMCIGLNYDEHIKEFTRDKKEAENELPIFFTKRPNSVIGPNEHIQLHTHATSMVDYEGELAIIIGKRGTNISESEAWDYVFGYTILNDVSARDLQRNHIQWFLGKSLDTFCPMGPYILLGDKQEKQFTLKTFVNGELRQSGDTHDFIHPIPELIATLSRGMTLEPGDIIATGTPSGVGKGFNPPRYLKSGDEVSITISDIGTLTNPVR